MDPLLFASLSALDMEGLPGNAPDWRVLGGGRTNALWVRQGADQKLVCKCYCGPGTELFSNDPVREVLVLQHLSGTGLAPHLVVASDTPPALLYRFVVGETWRGDLEVAAQGLRRIHQIAPPDLPVADHRPEALWASAEKIATALTKPSLRRIPPYRSAPTPYAPAFLHGDPVPSNMIETPQGLTFIDWQCPCVGDPATDLAVFLSPAMQALYGGRDISEEDRTAFLEMYDDTSTSDRYQALAPLLHWRIAVHCLWRAENGAPDYADAAVLEFGLLDCLA